MSKIDSSKDLADDVIETLKSALVSFKKTFKK